MIRPIKISLLTLSLALVVWASFAGGQRLRHLANGAIQVSERYSSLRDAGLGSADVTHAADQAEDSNPSETFLDVLRYVKSDYVDKITDDSRLSNGAVRTMLMSLDDPKTRFYDADQRKQYEDQLDGQFAGIGATVTVVKTKKGEIDQRRLAVVAPVPGGPADKAGVKPGDFVTEVDGRWVIAYDPRLDLDRLHTRDMTENQFRDAYKEAAKRLTEGLSLPKALDLLNSKDGKTLKLTLERPGAPQPIQVSVTTATTRIEPVEYKALDNGVGYLRVTEFNDQATRAFESALDGSNAKSLIVDLRSNAGAPVTGTQGGALNSALALLGKLTRGGQVGAIVGKGNKQTPLTASASRGPKARLAVLVNRGTANLAEMVAAALKDRAGAKLIGEQTWGDSTLQKFVPLRDGAAMTITAGKFLTARGVDFAGKGLQPDVAVVTGGPQPAGDPATQRALSTLAGA